MITVGLYDEKSKFYKYPSPWYRVKPDKKFNMVLHMNRCPMIESRKEWVARNRLCHYCAVIFMRKSTRCHHIQTYHPNEDFL